MKRNPTRGADYYIDGMLVSEHMFKLMMRNENFAGNLDRLESPNVIFGYDRVTGQYSQFDIQKYISEETTYTLHKWSKRTGNRSGRHYDAHTSLHVNTEKLYNDLGINWNDGGEGGKPDGDKTTKSKNNDWYAGFVFGTNVASRQFDIFDQASKGCFQRPKQFIEIVNGQKVLKTKMVDWPGFKLAGNAVSVISIFGDVMYLGYNMQNMSYGEIQKVQVDITSNVLTLSSIPGVQLGGILMNVTDMVGGFDWMYDNSNRLQQAGYSYYHTNPFQNPAFILIDK